MPMNQSFIQLILGLKNLSLQRQQQSLDEKKFTEGQNQFKEMVKQFEHTHQDKDLGEALKTFGDIMPEGRAAFAQLTRTRFAKDNPDAVEALIQTGMGMPTPAGAGQAQLQNALATGAGPPTPGLQQAFPQQQGMHPGAQAAVGAATGMSAPQVQQMGMQQNPAWSQMVRNYAEKQSRGYTDEEMAVSQFNATTGRRGSDVDWARVRESHDQFLAEYGLKGILAKGKNGLQPTDIVSLMRGMGDLLNDMKSPKASKEDNVARQQLFNAANLLLQQSGVTSGTGMFQAPNWQGQNAPVGDPNNPMSLFLRNQGVTGAPMPFPFQPQGSGSYNYQPRR